VPAFEVRSTSLVLRAIVVEAASEDEARRFAHKVWVADAATAAATAEIKRQPQRPDDTGDARSEARYEYSEHDALDDELREARSLGGAESEGE
jgi:hypothetical protein